MVSQMKNLKILIITEGDNLSSVAAMTVFKIVSSLNFGGSVFGKLFYAAMFS